MEQTQFFEKNISVKVFFHAFLWSISAKSNRHWLLFIHGNLPWCLSNFQLELSVIQKQSRCCVSFRFNPNVDQFRPVHDLIIYFSDFFNYCNNYWIRSGIFELKVESLNYCIKLWHYTLNFWIFSWIFDLLSFKSLLMSLFWENKCDSCPCSINSIIIKDKLCGPLLIKEHWRNYV